MAATVAAALPALAGVAVLGTTVGAICATVGSAAGTFALYGAYTMIAVDGVQTASGYTGHRLDGSKLSKSEAEARIQNGLANMSLAVTGGVLGASALATGGSGSTDNNNTNNNKNNNDISKGTSGTNYEVLENETINRTVGDKITGYTKHGLNQAIGRDGGKGVSPEAILDTVRNPKDIITQNSSYGPTYKYISDKAVVVLNEEGKVVTTYAKGSQWIRGGK